MARRNLGIDREVELAEMAPLPPFAQVIADMEGTGWFGSRRGCLCVHAEKPSTRRSCHPLPAT
jgi:hypothetical protein